MGKVLGIVLGKVLGIVLGIVLVGVLDLSPNMLSHLPLISHLSLISIIEVFRPFFTHLSWKISVEHLRSGQRPPDYIV